MGSNIDQETYQEQSVEDEIRFIVIQKEGQHLIHQMEGFLVHGERERDQSLKSLVIVQGVESDQSLSKKLVGITSRKSSDKVQGLRGKFPG